ncbi:MAG: TonB family protein [Leptospiraceae bacterium]|nr:TonB family protein [Leptospiraceae bacterium]
MDFDLKKYYPKEAKDANIRDKTLVMLIRVDELGNLVSAKIVSGKAGFGFDRAAEEVVRKVRFLSGHDMKGKPVKMSHRLVINFTLDD